MLWAFLLLSCAMVADSVGEAPDPSDTRPIELEVPRGTSPRGLGPILERAGAIDDGSDFTLYVRLTGKGGCLKAGRHRVQRSMSAEEVLEILCGNPLAQDVPFTVIEGWRIREVDAALAAKGWALPGEYTRLAAQPKLFSAPFPLPSTSLEGYLFPETYAVDPDRFTARAFIQRQLDTFSRTFWKPETNSGKDMGKRTLHQVVTMASMVVREEPTPKQRAMVAGILWKRLDFSWNLGVDATSRYTLAKWNDRQAFLKKLRDPSEPYNTRKRAGLPPTPIGNPDLSSLNAALRPVKSDFWYYLHDHDRVIRPSRSVREHEAKRRKYNVY
jgi:UPF0755 protein